MFKTELRALLIAGVHPHILRLIESFEDGSEELVLVLEFCDGGDLYELYASNNGCSMVEGFVIQLIRQLLLALMHLVERRVEHRDVKPENLLLYGASTDHLAVPQLKLADFGWAQEVMPDMPPAELPLEGVGSLWYAPPELNPPCEGVEQKGIKSPFLASHDMWSVGVITYLLLVGHSPFNSALYLADEEARAERVMRLAAAGRINTSSRPWPTLSGDAKSFIIALIQPDPAHRMSPAEAWEHPWLSKWRGDVAIGLGVEQVSSPGHLGRRGQQWQNLDGLQRLFWLALARAATEPELFEVPALQAAVCGRRHSRVSTYIEELASELAMVSAPSWFAPHSPWADVLRLAFEYLDKDSDGFLGQEDIMQHLVGDDAKEAAAFWLFKWRRTRDGMLRCTAGGLGFTDFCGALRSPASAAHVEASAASPATGAAPGRGPGRRGLEEGSAGGTEHRRIGDRINLFEVDAALDEHLQLYDRACQRFLDEEFNEHGFGL